MEAIYSRILGSGHGDESRNPRFADDVGAIFDQHPGSS
jgi:hypothetical protein